MRTIFIWQKLGGVINNQLPKGGVIVVAATLDDAIKAAEREGVIFGLNEWQPDFFYELVVKDCIEKVIKI